MATRTSVPAEERPPVRWVTPLVVFAIGALAIWFAASRGPHEDWAQFLSGHFGIALVVAAIVGLAYEYRVVERKILEQVREITNLHRREARDVLPKVVEAIFPVVPNTPDSFHHAQIQSSINELVNSVKELEAQKWAASDVPVKFVVRLLRYASDASAALAKPDASGGERTLSLPRSAAQLVDEILADQMKHLQGGESYCVISDFESWHDEQLKEFWKETQLAIKRSVHVRRVFCRLGGDNRLSAQDARKTLETHWREAERSPIVNGRPTYDVAVCVSERWFPHYGVFRYRDGGIISFEPTPDSDLSEIRFSRAPQMAKFEECWGPAIKFATETDGGGFRPTTFAELLKHIDEHHEGWWSYFRGR